MKLEHTKLILNRFLTKSVEIKHTHRKINILHRLIFRCRRKGILYWFYLKKVKLGCENR